MSSILSFLITEGFSVYDDVGNHVKAISKELLIDVEKIELGYILIIIRKENNEVLVYTKTYSWGLVVSLIRRYINE